MKLLHILLLIDGVQIIQFDGQICFSKIADVFNLCIVLTHWSVPQGQEVPKSHHLID